MTFKELVNVQKLTLIKQKQLSLVLNVYNN